MKILFSINRDGYITIPVGYRDVPNLMRKNLMFAIRQIIDDPQDAIPIPPELLHRRTEVIFIAMDDEEGKAHLTPSPLDAIEAFRGKGKGNAVTRLLVDRHSDREHDG